MKIGELARRGGVGIDTVRYYEREGLLPPARRLASGYRTYSADDLQRLQFVLRAKVLGFTLSQVRELLVLTGGNGSDVAQIKVAARQKLLDIDAKLAELQQMRATLSALVAACPGEGELSDCPIHGVLAGEQA